MNIHLAGGKLTLVNGVTVDLPLYRSHKVVAAAKILEVRPLPFRVRLDLPHRTGEDDGEFWFQPKALASTIVPEAGWYVVLYEDGYISFSPAKAFEEGYMPIDETKWFLTTGTTTTPESEPGAAAGASDGPAAAAAPLVPRRCGAGFQHEGERGEGRHETCALPQGHEGDHLSVFDAGLVPRACGHPIGADLGGYACDLPADHPGAHSVTLGAAP